MSEEKNIHNFAAKANKSPYIFEGTLQKIQLRSNKICFLPPEPNDEIKQHLTITADGRVWLSRYRFGTVGNEHGLIEKLNFSISPKATDSIMKAVSGYFGNEYPIHLASDVGSWDLTLTNTNGQFYRKIGPLWGDLQTENGGLSDLIRSELERNDLFVFDGNPNYVTKVEIRYHRNTKIKPDVIRPKTAREYSELLILDRSSETLEHVREIGIGCKIRNIYSIKEDIDDLLNGLGTNVFSEIEGNPPDAIDDPLETKDYTIAIHTKHGGERTVSGTFDRNGLPTDWSKFINTVYDFMTSYGIGELFDERVYGKPKRRQSDCIFCNVKFEDGGRTYCYLADSDEYSEGDLVVVPTGADNREAVVRIESIEYHPAEEAPFPLEKTKRILRKYTKED